MADPPDQYHTRAGEELDRVIAAGTSVAVTYLTLAEAYTLVVRRLGPAYAHRWLGQLADGSMLINPEARDYLRAFDLISRLSLAVWTYDRHFDLLKIKRWT